MPESDRTTVRADPDTARLAALDEDEELWLRHLLDRLPDHLELDETTALIYGVPKLARGLGLDDAPTDEVKADQKAFFRLLYELLVDAERGPRLPTLFLALGAEKVRSCSRPIRRLDDAPSRLVRTSRLGVGQPVWAQASPSSSSYAVGLESRRNSEQRSHSSVSPMLRAASASRARQIRKPRLGSCSHGTGPWPFQPLRRSMSRLRW